MGRAPVNMGKNADALVIPYDHTRVKLTGEVEATSLKIFFKCGGSIYFFGESYSNIYFSNLRFTFFRMIISTLATYLSYKIQPVAILSRKRKKRFNFAFNFI